MIIFLTVIYVVALLLLIKLKVLKPVLWVKLSPLAWMAFLLTALFIPMQFTSPAGDVRQLSHVIPIVPRVAGRVIEVLVEPNVAVREGDVLFRIDPRPFQYQVDKLRAALEAANVSTASLEEKLKAARAATAQARANLVASESDFDRSARKQLEAAEAQVRRAEADLGLAQKNNQRAVELDEADAISKLDLDETMLTLERANAELERATAASEQARLATESGSERIKAARQQVAQAEAREREAENDFEAQIDGENPQVRQIAADLSAARLNLEETTVYAPADGYATNLALRPGASVAAIPLSPAMAFVTRETGLVMFVKQTQVRHVRPGQDAEIVFDLYPGKVFKATVHSIVQGTAQGQLKISGTMASISPEARGELVVKLDLSEPVGEFGLPPGVGGTAAVYTGKGKSMQVIRRVMMRMQTWLNFVR